jgi:uncharacterized RDD family membrane protein YckC
MKVMFIAALIMLVCLLLICYSVPLILPVGLFLIYWLGGTVPVAFVVSVVHFFITPIRHDGNY